ncbi:MAG: hypothetical protein RLZZ501_1848, partial [Pseudomonadota bacterium]
MAPRALSFLLVLVLGWPASALAQDKAESRSETGKVVDAVIDGVGDFLNVLGGPPISSPNAFLNLPAAGDDSAAPTEKQPAAAPAPAHPAVAVPAAPPPAGTVEATPAAPAPTTPPRRQTPRPATAAAPVPLTPPVMPVARPAQVTPVA